VAMHRDTKQLGLFDYQSRLEDLASRPNALDRLNQVVDWEVFRPVLTKLVVSQPLAPGGRPRFDVVMMFKLLVLQRTYSLSDEQAELQVLDRFSFQRFLGLTVADDVPRRTTIWDYREALRHSGGEGELWKAFDRLLAKAGVKLTAGKIIDASFVDVPRQRNGRDEIEAIKRGEQPPGWDKKSPPMLRQKDTDARWVRKGPETHFGYKNSIKIDRKTKLIESFVVTSAEVNDSMMVEDLARRGDGVLHADKAYRGRRVGQILARLGIVDRRHLQGRYLHPLNNQQEGWNHARSRVRARVEHVFAGMAHMGADYIRCIGAKRARFTIGLNNLVWNLHRLAFLRAGRA
jgi:transposase, IS5 family